MDGVKTYHQVDRHNKGAFFGISSMASIYEKRNGKTDDPHRHDFFTLLLVKEARGTHLIDFSSHPLQGNNIYFIGPGQVHQVIEEHASKGYSIVFSEDFLVRNAISKQFIEELNLFREFGDSPPLPLLADDLDHLLGLAETMQQWHQTESPWKQDALGALLKLFLIHCRSLCSVPPMPSQLQENGQTLLRDFKELVDQKHAKWHATSTYAEALHVTADHLNKVVKTLTGKTAKSHIQSRIIVAAKRRLFHTDQSLKEIGYALGFNEPANFSAFFKKCTGTAPSHFKSSFRNGNS
ncbi:MAG: helix-turn-helix domain-containing protein [Flavobacteriaceae bacterium]|nr:helix-turn-helix domain-containing protein [Flavobacteriaceae bacterium]